MPAHWRLVDEVGGTRDPAGHMDTDLRLLDEVAGGAAPALRLYTWEPPTLSVGRFQDLAQIDTAACARHGVPVVRRPTGGAALLHGADLTYSVVLALPPGREGSVRAVYELVAGALITGLSAIGVIAAVAHHDGPPGPVCFAGQQGADLRVGDRKLCGSAQVRRAGTVLQHGSILLRRLAIDECDLTVGECDRDALRRATVTLEELDAPTDPHRVAEALLAGFAEHLAVAFSASASHTAPTLAEPGRR